MNNYKFIFIDDKYIGVDLGIKVSDKDNTLLLSLPEFTLNFMDHYMPNGYMGAASFRLELREGESPNECKTKARFEECLIEPDSEQWHEFQHRPPSREEKSMNWFFLIRFTDWEVMDALELESHS